MLSFSDYKDRISKSVHYHIENNIPFTENIYRVHSEEFYKLFREARSLYNEGLLTELSAFLTKNYLIQILVNLVCMKKKK